MSTKKYVGDKGLSHFLVKLKEIFGLKTSLDTSKSLLNTYVLNIKIADSDSSGSGSGSGSEDDTILDFESDTLYAVLGVGKLGNMILGKEKS